MLRKHVAAIVGMPVTLRVVIRQYFALPGNIAITPAMYQRGLGQADLVLALLRVDHWHARLTIERLIGRPIVIGSPCLLRYPTNGPPTAARAADPLDRKIAWILPRNPRQPATQAFIRWPEYRVGRSLSQLYVRGVRKRDVRLALRRGWIRLEATA